MISEAGFGYSRMDFSWSTYSSIPLPHPFSFSLLHLHLPPPFSLPAPLFLSLFLLLCIKEAWPMYFLLLPPSLSFVFSLFSYLFISCSSLLLSFFFLIYIYFVESKLRQDNTTILSMIHFSRPTHHIILLRITFSTITALFTIMASLLNPLKVPLPPPFFSPSSPFCAV